MSTKTVEAIILGRRNIGEADRLVTAFSKEEGKIKFVARGSRKLKSKMAAHIEPFSVGRYFLATGKTFNILAGAETTEMNFDKAGDFELFSDAAYLCELTGMVEQEGQPNEALYKILSICLRNISVIENSKREILLRYFEFTLLKHSGYQPNYQLCHKCKKPLQEKETYQGGFEGVFCGNCESSGKNISVDTLKVLRLLEKDDLPQVLKISGIETINENLKGVILPYLYDILPKTPKSKSL